MDIYSLSHEDWAAEMQALDQPKFRAGQIVEWLYEKRVAAWSQMTNLPAALRTALAEKFPWQKLELLRVTGSDDTTRKFLWKLEDGQLIETVLIPASPALYGDAADRRTLCVSSQVGCAYGCKFCASGLDGWKRNLTTGEIVQQLLQVEAIAGERVNNIVFMGMGEPMANYENLINAIGILNAPWGGKLGARHMTVSTSGLVPGIIKLAEQPLQVRLAISLHGASDDVRNQIMPVNQKYPLAELLDACAFYVARKKQRITFEYILIQGVNDTIAQATQLAELANSLGAKINLIPYNTVTGLDWVRPSDEQQDTFLLALKSGGADATLRREKGHDIAAACGQLRLQVENSFAETGALN